MIGPVLEFQLFDKLLAFFRVLAGVDEGNLETFSSEFQSNQYSRRKIS